LHLKLRERFIFFVGCSQKSYAVLLLLGLFSGLMNGHIRTVLWHRERGVIAGTCAEFAWGTGGKSIFLS
jgi:hypothetical protein